jgi:hypothetical protein
VSSKSQVYQFNVFYAAQADTINKVTLYGLSAQLNGVTSGSEPPLLYAKSADADKFAEDCTQPVRQMILCKFVYAGDVDSFNKIKVFECQSDLLAEPAYIIQYQYKAIQSS